MKMDVASFLAQHDYDVRKSHNAGWIDQKCTHDVISMIADCILEYLEQQQTLHPEQPEPISFTIRDIWHSDYAVENVQAIFVKPNPKHQARNEYDKYFSQPIKLLAYSRILNETRIGTQLHFTVAQPDILKQLTLRPLNALAFLQQ